MKHIGIEQTTLLRPCDGNDESSEYELLGLVSYTGTSYYANFLVALGGKTPFECYDKFTTRLKKVADYLENPIAGKLPDDYGFNDLAFSRELILSNLNISDLAEEVERAIEDLEEE